jgi:hypothetical protein
MIISGWILLKIRKFQTEVVHKMKTHILCTITFLKNLSVYEIMRKNTGQPERSKEYGACAFHHGQQKQQTQHIHSMQYYCLFTARMVTWTRFNIVLYIYCLLPVLSMYPAVIHVGIITFLAEVQFPNVNSVTDRHLEKPRRQFKCNIKYILNKHNLRS